MKILVATSKKSSIEELKSYFNSEKGILNFLLSNYSFMENATYVDHCTPLLERERHIDDYFAFVVFAMSASRTPISKMK